MTIADLGDTLKNMERLDRKRKTAADIRTGLSHADVAASQFHRDVERVLSYLEADRYIMTTHGSASLWYPESINYRLPSILMYLEACGIVWSEPIPGTGTYWRKVRPA